MSILAVIIITIITFIIGIIIGFIVGILIMKKIIKKEFSNEKMIRSIFKGMGQKPNESQIKNIIKTFKQI